MKKTKHSEEKIIAAVKQLEAGRPVKELARELGVSDQTLYNWKSKYGGMEVSDAKKLRALEDENRRLKQLVADLSLDPPAPPHRSWRVYAPCFTTPFNFQEVTL